MLSGGSKADHAKEHAKAATGNPERGGSEGHDQATAAFVVTSWQHHQLGVASGPVNARLQYM